MRKEKILEILENAKDENGAVPMRLVRTAFDKLPEPCKDTISRQAAIDAYGDWYVEEGTAEGFIGTVKQLLEGLPSAQPEIIRCKDCENWDTTWQNDFAPNYHYCPIIDGTYSGDFYCAKAERRT